MLCMADSCFLYIFADKKCDCRDYASWKVNNIFNETTLHI